MRGLFFYRDTLVIRPSMLQSDIFALPPVNANLLEIEKGVLFSGPKATIVKRSNQYEIWKEEKTMPQQEDLTNRLIEVGSQQRARLIQLCTRMTGRSDVAEDLAQETLLEAWRHLHSLRDPQRFSSWLDGIARNLCLRWKRAQERERAHSEEQQRAGQFLTDDREAALIDEFDLEIELERKELAELLDRALALLPAETRLLLIERYIQESPLVEIAGRLGISLDTATKRLQRGRLAFRQTLTTNFQQELAPYVPVCAGGGWQATRLWCFVCGQRHLSARVEPTMVHFACLADGPQRPHASFHVQTKHSMQGYRRMFASLLAWIEGFYGPHLALGRIPCTGCGRSWPITIDPDGHGFQVGCPACQKQGREWYGSLSLAQQPVRQFWQEQDKIRLLPTYGIETDGRLGLVVPFESVSSQAGIAVVLARDTYEVLRIVSTHSGAQ
jgi:RNA polymerase sigma-70 factor (ECF subfamily)